MKTNVMFTVLPRPVWEPRPTFSIFTTLVPEADTSGATLNDFPTVANWPTVIRNSSFELYRLDGGTSAKIGQCIVHPYATAQDAQAIWSAILPLATQVSVPAPAPLRSTSVLGYDFASLVDVVRDVYQPLTINQAGSPIKSIPGLDWFGTEEVMNTIEGFTVAPRSDFWQFARYHLPDRRASKDLKRLDEQPDDFDRRLSEIGNYPALYRLLGLILDVEVELDPGANLPTHGAVAVLPAINSSHGGALDVVLPWSRYERFTSDGKTYAHMASDAPRQRGFYTLDPERIRLVQYNLDTAVYGLMKAARAEKDADAGLIARADVPSTPPTLSSPGFSLYDKQILPDLNEAGTRAAQLKARSVTLHAAGPDPTSPVLTASDTEAGCRVDVHWSKTGQWHSLSKLQLSALFRPGTVVDLNRYGPTEGQTSLATSSTVDPNSPNDSQAKSSQRLFGWMGWSLAAARIENAVNDTGQPTTARIEPSRWQVKARAEAGSLPKLRFGDSYAFRCRSVDLAGNGWSLAEANVIAKTVQHVQTETQRFLRNEPVLSPVIVAPEALSKGETKAVLATGSGRGASRRLAYSPAASFDLLEKHGVFDELDELAGYTLLTLAVEKPPVTEAPLTFPYASDPIATGVTALIDGGGSHVPLGAAALSTKVERDEDDCVEIILKSGRFGARRQGRKFVVSLPKGESRRLRLRSAISAHGRKLLAFDGGGAEPSEVASPGVDLLLVHPTEVPLAPPTNGKPDLITRKRGDTHIAYVDPGVGQHRPTTSRLTFEATWTDRIDDPAKPDWTERSGSGVIATQDVKIDPHEALAFTAARQFSRSTPLGYRSPIDQPARTGLFNNEADPANSFDFQDTHSRWITVTPVAHTRHAEFFDETAVRTVSGQPVRLLVKSTANPKSPTVDFILPTAIRQRHRAGHGKISQSTTGWGLRVYLERDWRDGEELALVFGPPTELDPSGQTPAPTTPAGWRSRMDGQSGIGQDPLVRSSEALSALSPSDLIGSDPRSHLLPVDDRYEATGDPTYAVPVQFAHFATDYDPEKNLRFVDLVFRARPKAYLPFVRLVFARYNPDSIEGAELSRASTVQWAQLGGNRSITAARLAERHYRIRIVADGADESKPRSRTRFFAHAEYSEYNRGSEYGWTKDEGTETELRLAEHLGPFVFEGVVQVHPWRLLGNRRIIVQEVLELASAECPTANAARLIAFEIVDI